MALLALLALIFFFPLVLKTNKKYHSTTMAISSALVLLSDSIELDGDLLQLIPVSVFIQ